MEEVVIKISGGGTKEEIVQALRVLADSIESYSQKELLEGKEFEDATLMTVTY